MSDHPMKNAKYPHSAKHKSQRQFTPFEIQLCLYDAERTESLSAAVRELVKPGSVVIDAGSGTGVLGLLAAKHGASTVYCIESDPRFCRVIAENAKRNGLSKRVHVLCGDATLVDIPEKVDLVVAELISGGLFFEPLVQVINHLRQFLKPDGKIMPKALNLYAEFICAQEDLYGLKFNFDSRYVALDDIGLTSMSRYFQVDFGKHVPTTISAEACLEGVRQGIANAVRIKTDVWLTEKIHISRPTEFFLNPEVLYLKNRLAISEGEEYKLHVNYVAGSDTLDNVSIRINGTDFLPIA